MEKKSLFYEEKVSYNQFHHWEIIVGGAGDFQVQGIIL
jgi:hypothetical protein